MRLTGIFACFIFSWANAQNLIPNPSFEDENICELAIPCSPAAWYSVSNMPYGYENKFTHHINGNRAISFLIALKQEARTYWQVPLLSDIKQGEKYTLHFHLYSPVKKINPEYFGIYFSNTFFRSAKDKILQTPQWLKITGASIQSSKNNWQEINFEFKAAEDAKYMLMGNFCTISNQDILKAYGKKTEVLEYYIDDISLIPSEPLNKTESEIVAKRLDSLYQSNIRHKYPVESIPIAVKSVPKPASSTIDTLVLGRINFDFDSYELLHKEIIKKYFGGLDQHTIEKIIVTGYTDSVGRNDYNLRLSENRAISVKKYLSDSLDIPKNLIFTEGRGKTNDQKLQENNRRVELVIYRKE